jgi:hypothetical protein
MHTVISHNTHNSALFRPHCLLPHEEAEPVWDPFPNNQESDAQNTSASGQEAEGAQGAQRELLVYALPLFSSKFVFLPVCRWKVVHTTDHWATRAMTKIGDQVGPLNAVFL